MAEGTARSRSHCSIPWAMSLGRVPEQARTLGWPHVAGAANVARTAAPPWVASRVAVPRPCAPAVGVLAHAAPAVARAREDIPPARPVLTALATSSRSWGRPIAAWSRAPAPPIEGHGRQALL